jgi:hypothetical protein
VPLFRKKETYNEQMLREAGLNRVVINTPPQRAPESVPDDPPRVGHGGMQMNRMRGGWDTTTMATAPGVEGDRVRFTALPNGDLIVTDGGDGDLSPLADAIEKHVSPPYKAVASRVEGDRWGVGVTRIEVATIPFPGAQALELAQTNGVSEFDVDEEPSDTTPPAELQQLGERIAGDFCVEASRIDGDYWEVKVSPL